MNKNIKKYGGGGGFLDVFINGIKKRLNDPSQPQAWGYSTPQQKLQTTQKNYSQIKKDIRERTPEEKARLKDPKIQSYLQRISGEAKNKIITTGNTRKVIKQKPTYTTDPTGMGLSEEEKLYISKAGFNPNDITSVQNFILKQTNNAADLGARKGVGIADGYWGGKSKTALQELRNQGIFTTKVDEQEPIKPVNSVPIDAPDFGYKSEGDYSVDQAEILKTNGIRDWGSLINYAGKNKDSDFTKLLSGYFGTNDITQWDRNKLETDAKIHGTYHGQDRAQLQGFLGGLQDINNQKYYTRVATYSKQNNPTTPKFDFSKFTKLNLPEYKFNLSNTGASTLGDAGITLGNDLGKLKGDPIYGKYFN